MSAPDPNVLAKALDWLKGGRQVALATVVQTWGSAPQPVGSLLVIDGEGNFLGSVSGGCVEAEVVAQAAEVIASDRPRTLEFGVEDQTAWKVGLACGGTIRVFLERLDAEEGDARRGVLHRLIGDVEARRRVALVMELGSGTRRLAHAPGDVEPEIATALEEAFRRDKSLAVAGGETFINVFNPTLRFVVIGAVHVAQHLVLMARALGYHVLIIDPRTAFATQERFSDVEVVRDWPEDTLPKIGLDDRTAVVVLTHDPRIDDPALVLALDSDSFYVGALGSRKTHSKRVERLLKAGVSLEAIERIHAPIGLDIGAEGGAEIALSIIAEITAEQRGKSRR
jgi:xanthine dehydrogenase accessory factor